MNTKNYAEFFFLPHRCANFAEKFSIEYCYEKDIFNFSSVIELNFKHVGSKTNQVAL